MTMKRRHAISLVEMVAAMAVGSVIMGVAVTMLYTLLRMDRVARERIERSAVLCRLSEQFREDVRSATEAIEDDAAASWKFILAAEHAVTYTAESGRVARVETVGEGPPRREWYRLPPGAVVTIQIPSPPAPLPASGARGEAASPPTPLSVGEARGEGTQPTIVSLSVAPEVDDSELPGSPVARFDAVLAADHRFEQPAASEEEIDSPEETVASSDEDSNG